MRTATAAHTRTELFSASQLEELARELAGREKVVTGPVVERLLPRLAVNQAELAAAYVLVTDAVRLGRRITPAAEWFVDNYPLVEEQIRTARRHLSPGFSRALPRAATGEAAGLPRVYELALALISHSHGRVDLDGLRSFITAYQSVDTLRLGELWALPIMLRLALLENLRRIIADVTLGRRAREAAAAWSGRLHHAAAISQGHVVLVLAELVREDPPLTDAFAAELAGSLQGQALQFPILWLEHRLAERGHTTERVFQRVSQSQAADQVAVGNTIGTLRFLGAADWREFVEEASRVEHALREDPSGVYPNTDFATRDRCRHVVEAIAARTGRPEQQVALAAVGLARAAGKGPVAGHVGWWLLGPGLSGLEHSLGLRASVGGRLALRLRWVVYLGAIGGLTVALTLAGVAVGPALGWVAIAALALALSELASAIVQWGAMVWVPPTLLPRLDFSKGIPAAHRAVVAVPTLLTDAAGVDSLLEDLAVRRLANVDAELGFALVTDFRDAATRELPGDAELLARAREGIEALNRTSGGAAPFHLLHRARRWNPAEGVWMGWERKRGKLEQLNAALRGDASGFDCVVGDLEWLQGVQSVIALDTDTRLPRDAARELVGVLAHPLNRPRYDPRLGRVVEGYGILQPRVGVTLSSARASRFAAWFAGEPGIDPYTRAVSDVYQDLFGEGSFVGKGIYDVDAFARATAGRLPENRILSHDLLEGSYARAGFVSDVLLFEDHPTTWSADVSRRSRWTRGDWQIAPWFGPWIPSPTGWVPNPLPPLARWKVFDNLRRSLVPVALLALLVGGWVTGAAGAATAVVVAILTLPGVVVAAADLVRRPRELRCHHHGREIAHALALRVVRDLVSLGTLPYEAALSIVAIGRTVGRLTSGRRLLEWRTAADAHRSARTTLSGTYASMAVVPLTALTVAGWLALNQPGSWLAASSVLGLWVVTPAVIWWLSCPIEPAPSPLGAEDAAFLRAVARRTWRFFEVFVGEDDNHLPPDNFQEDPARGVAHRTSPTNIGLALTASLGAYDFGYLTAGSLVARAGRTLATLDRMEKYRGHLYNWYDTRSLAPLLPLYVSTVDSGNLAGHLLTLASGLDELGEQPVFRAQTRAGLVDALDLVAEEAPALELGGLRAQLERTPTGLAEARRWLEQLIAEAPPGAGPWANAFRAQCAEALSDLLHLAPWLALEREPLEAPTTLADIARLDPEGVYAEPFAAAVSLGAARARERLDQIRGLADRCRALSALDCSFLYDRDRRLLSIGFRVAEHRSDPGFYDLLASEARLASFVAIAQGRLPREHWFGLGRLLTSQAGRPVLLSWSGSMFEYLMPLLVMPTFTGTILDETYRGVVARQIAYARERGTAWGVSESGYAKTDAQLDYQYSAFGVPGLGFKRGLADDLVVAPYASALALMVDPVAATANLRRLSGEGLLGPYGWYEALDLTPARLPRGARSVTVRSFMSHHQGMTFLSIAHALLGQPMQRRFLADPSLRATELLLQERVPRTPPVYPHPADLAPARQLHAGRNLRVITTPSTPAPEVQLLSNGTYHVAVTHTGGGYSRWRGLAVTRWHEDPTRDCWGSFCYLRDVTPDGAGAFWSVAHQPTLVAARRYEAIFSLGRAEFRRADGDIESHVEISVSPEDDIELRRVTLTNAGRTARTIELTTYSEVVLAPPAADAAHPAFSNLFVQTEIVRERRAVLCTRRPRSDGERPPWMLHLVTVDGVAGPTSFETARGAFVGRGRTSADPIAMHLPALADGQGAVLDPVAAIRTSVVLEPYQSIRVHLVTGVAETRDAALALVDKYSDRHSAERVFDLSWTHDQVLARRLDATEADTLLYERLVSHVLFANPAMRAPPTVIARNRSAQSGLWAYSLSGDLPIVLLKVSSREHLGLVRQLVQAHAYWRVKGVSADLVVWNGDPSGYRQVLHEEILAVVAAVSESSLVDRPGGIFVRRVDQLSEEDKVLMQTVARVIVDDADGPLADQVDRRRVEVRGPRFVARVPLAAHPGESHRFEPPALTSFNGLGGFERDGREYVIVTRQDHRTPAPWVNVLANRWFGTVVSESGGAYTWCENARSYRLTPWHNDPVGDSAGEATWIRDEDDGRFWSPTPLPAGGARPYVTRHGFGYTRFEYADHGISTDLVVFVPVDAPLKVLRFTVRNTSGRPRRLSVTTCFELVLGETRPTNLPHVVTELDPGSGAILARNAWSSEFGSRVAFLDCSREQRSVSGDRQEILGRNGTWAAPQFVRRARLSGRTGAGLDPCLAMQLELELGAGEEQVFAFTFGSGRDLADARSLASRYRDVGAAAAALAEVRAYWDRLLGAVQVHTPDATLDLLANGWLLYQVLSSRLLGRSGFYQSGGAYGFRDQLQDAMALVHADPAALRAQIVRAAGRQFPEGDVQHWWHPPLGRGVRTRISDDYLFLPFALCRYLEAIDDPAVLDEVAPFLQGRSVRADEDSYYDLPGRSEEAATVYEHCVRAIRHGLPLGAHGLPLMGSGDWNDGMNLVGDGGRGESVWLAFFLYDVLVRFGAVAARRGDDTFAVECASAASDLRRNVEAHGWDGEWYLRAWFDDGEPLGASTSPACQIDSLPQSWAALSGAADPARARRALDSVYRRLVRRDLGLIQLFDPPFDGVGPNPGYVAGYLPGVRENGSQYTHAAVWVAMAFAALGDAPRAWELFAMLDPVHHGDSEAAIARYKVEPYVMAADVYTNPAHAGRGGWTWYTGAAGWMYRLVVESLLGVRLEGDRLRVEPLLPEGWPGFEVRYRHRDTPHRVSVRRVGRGSAVARVLLDGVDAPERSIRLCTDGAEHQVVVEIGGPE